MNGHYLEISLVVQDSLVSCKYNLCFPKLFLLGL